MKQQKFIKQLILNIFLFLLSLMYVLPFFLIISASLADENMLKEYGYTFFPKTINLDAYKYVFKNPTQLINSYKTTIIMSVAVLIFGTLNMCMAAYPLSRKKYPLAKKVAQTIF